MRIKLTFQDISLQTTFVCAPYILLCDEVLLQAPWKNTVKWTYRKNNLETSFRRRGRRLYCTDFLLFRSQPDAPLLCLLVTNAIQKLNIVTYALYSCIFTRCFEPQSGT